MLGVGIRISSRPQMEACRAKVETAVWRNVNDKPAVLPCSQMTKKVKQTATMVRSQEGKSKRLGRQIER